jgi:retron-type reverse transcriptase
MGRTERHIIWRWVAKIVPVLNEDLSKGGGAQRALSIQSTEDKIAEHAAVTLPNQIYEADFRGFSYGFRQGRRQHDALDALAYGICKKKVNWVLDLAIRQCFDTVEYDWLIRMVRHRVRDKRLVKRDHTLDKSGCAAIAVRRFELVAHLAIAQQGQPLFRNRGLAM